MYEHCQVGYVTGGVLGGAALLILFLSIFWGDVSGWVQWLCYLVSLGLIAGVILFSSLTVEVEKQELRFFFGPGFWEKRISLQKISEVRVVRNSIYYGWGIRYTPHGWLYTVSGLQAVELQLKDGQTLRVGTDEPQRLHRAIKRALASQ